MLCRMLVMLVFLGLTKVSSGIDVPASIRRIDPDKRVAVVFANGQERTVSIAADVRILDQAGVSLNQGLHAPELKAGTAVTLTLERQRNMPTIVAIRLGGVNPAPQKPAAVSAGRRSAGLKPLSEMTAADRYKGEDGGLYGGGSNEMPETLSSAAIQMTGTIQPLDANGAPAREGMIGLVSISMSNATQEFSRFKLLADADPDKSAHLQIVDCAQGGQTMARWAQSDGACWAEAGRRLRIAGVTSRQVQVAWIKIANAGPSGELTVHGKQLDRDTRTVLGNLLKFFPNLRIAYLSSRTYGGYADGRLNPEPFAYEGAFVVRWLIQSQMAGDLQLNFDAAKGSRTAPLLLWGPYLWSDGVIPRRNDGLTWERSDFVEDGTHPSATGRQKVAEQLLNFFKNDRLARTWYMK